MYYLWRVCIDNRRISIIYRSMERRPFRLQSPSPDSCVSIVRPPFVLRFVWCAAKTRVVYNPIQKFVAFTTSDVKMGKMRKKAEPQRNFSKTLMKMKFMNPDDSNTGEEVLTIKSEHKLKDKDKNVTEVGNWEPFYDVLPISRFSFNGMNPDVEKVMKKLGVMQRDVNKHGAMDVDITVEEMIIRKNKMKENKI